MLSRQCLRRPCARHEVTSALRLANTECVARSIPAGWQTPRNQVTCATYYFCSETIFRSFRPVVRHVHMMPSMISLASAPCLRRSVSDTFKTDQSITRQGARVGTQPQERAVADHGTASSAAVVLKKAAAEPLGSPIRARPPSPTTRAIPPVYLITLCHTHSHTLHHFVPFHLSPSRLLLVNPAILNKHLFH